nr:hypothetical protein [Sphingomonas sp.]
MFGEETKVCGVPTEVPATAERARWLAELSDVLNEAHDLLTSLNPQGEQRPDAFELYLRIEAARLEVQSMQLSRSLQPRQETGPKWIGSDPWMPASNEEA